MKMVKVGSLPSNIIVVGKDFPKWENDGGIDQHDMGKQTIGIYWGQFVSDEKNIALSRLDRYFRGIRNQIQIRYPSNICVLSMELEQIAAILYALIVVPIVLFQFCLVFGAPWGQFTQGGQYEGPLPIAGRVAALLSVPILLCMGASITSAAGLAPNWTGWTAYVAIAMQALSTMLNWITPSRKERLLWGPITSIMLVIAAYVVF